MSQRPPSDVRKVLALSSSPRRDGNSRLLAGTALDGVREAGHSAELVHLDDHLQAFLRDCRLCRSPEGYCTIDDGFDALFREKFLPADGIVLATPIYWYGVSVQLKTFFDRIFCYIAASYPESEKIVGGLVGKKIALLLSSEESYTGASLGILHEITGVRPLHPLPVRGFRSGHREQARRRTAGPRQPRGPRPRAGPDTVRQEIDGLPPRHAARGLGVGDRRPNDVRYPMWTGRAPHE